MPVCLAPQAVAAAFGAVLTAAVAPAGARPIAGEAQGMAELPAIDAVAAAPKRNVVPEGMSVPPGPAHYGGQMLVTDVAAMGHPALLLLRTGGEGPLLPAALSAVGYLGARATGAVTAPARSL